MEFLRSRYALTETEANDLESSPCRQLILDDVERFRESHGFPAADSSLVRGFLLDKMYKSSEDGECSLCAGRGISDELSSTAAECRLCKGTGVANANT